jgi:type I restriction enzyme R subunit
MTPEVQARQKIDEQLVACGWVIQNYKAVDLSAGRGIALREVPLKTGPCDYLLLVDRIPIGVIEAKKTGTTLSGVADQSADYASALPDFLAKLLPHGIATLPFLYESTGVETYFRDERDPHPRSRRVFTFHRPETLADFAAQPDTLRARLAAMPTAHPLLPYVNSSKNSRESRHDQSRTNSKCLFEEVAPRLPRRSSCIGLAAH